jgi:hypothetical protein
MFLTDDTLRSYNSRCDPFQPLLDAEDPRYLSLDDVRGNNATSCVAALEGGIRVKSNVSCQLVTGFPGTGKSTELRQFQRSIEKINVNAGKIIRTRVVYIDFEKWINIYASLSLVQVLAVIAHNMEVEATRAEGGDPEKADSYLRRFWNYVHENNAEFKNISFDVYGTKLLFEVKVNNAFRRKVEDAITNEFQTFVTDAHESISKSAQRLRSAGEGAERIVVIADGIEKIRPMREDDRKDIEMSVENVFVDHADFLKIPCHVIYTFPPSLRYRANVGAPYGVEPLMLPMVKVKDQNGKTYEPGVDKLVKMIELRLDAKQVFGEDPATAILPLILHSGGYLRDLLRFVRAFLRPHVDFPVSHSRIAASIDVLAEEYQRTVFGTDLELLGLVAKEHSPPREALADLAPFGRLVERHLVLAYRNGREWYDLHPLVRQDPMVAEYLKKMNIS